MLPSHWHFLGILSLWTFKLGFAFDPCAGYLDCNAFDSCYCEACFSNIQCVVCGTSYLGSSPLRCKAYNATFDDLTEGGNITDYTETTWNNVAVANRDLENPITPSSKKNYIRSLSGTTSFNFTSGYSVFGYNVGSLHNFDFACGHPSHEGSASDRAVACYITIVATCVYVFDSGDQISGGSFTYNHTMTYQPYGKRVAQMTSGFWNSSFDYPPLDYGYTYYSYVCSDYTFTATQFNGKPAVLYLDNVVTNNWWSGYD